MKKIIITILISGLFVFDTSSKPISKETAMTVAKYFMKSKKGTKKALIIDEVYTREYNNEQVFFIVNFKEKAFVIVSGDDSVIPILGYSIKDTYNLNDMAPPNEDLLVYYEDAIYSRIINKVSLPGSSGMWEKLLNADFEQKKKFVPPLIQSEWGQRRSNDDSLAVSHCEAYNHYVSQTSSDCDCNEKCPTGCVSVAVSQIMKYWAHPVSWNVPGWDSKFFNWCNMPNELLFKDGNNPDYITQRNAISELMVHVGKLTHMEYCGLFNNVCQSSSSIWFARDAFLAYNYDTGVKIKRRDNYTDSEWRSLLFTELNNQRPIYYRGQRDAEKAKHGHAFICDGYAPDGIGNIFFHFNFGWNGSNNGYYYLDNINPRPTPYIYNQKILTNVYPKEGTEFDCNTQVIVRQSFLYDPNSMALYLNPTSGYIYTSEADPVDISSPFSVEYSAYNSIRLKNFRVRDGAQFRARITDCPANCGDAVRFAQTDKNTMTEIYSESNIRESEAHTIKIYPNPASTHISIQVQGLVNQEITYRLYNTQAMQLSEIRSGHSQLQIPVSHLPEGLYILQIIGEDINMSRKIVLKK